MQLKLSTLLSLALLAVLVSACSTTGELVFLRQVTGPVNTNCYLLYDAHSREAALIDVGGPIDSLLAHIEMHDLQLKYIFATHTHIDHVEGVPQVREMFPEAQLGYNRADWDDSFLFIEWLEREDPETAASMRQDPVLGKWFQYDLSSFGPPDIYLDDNQIYKLGNLEIRTLLTPGHSRGHISFAVGDVLFSGSVLFYRQVGRTDLMGGSEEDIVASVHRLYREFPDHTMVYPNHGRYTDIGTEKRENEAVPADAVTP